MLFLLAAILFALQLLDWWSTRTIINKGGYEQNKIMAKLFDLFGMDAVLSVKAIIVTALGYVAGCGAIELLAAIVVVYVAVIIHNFNSLR